MPRGIGYGRRRRSFTKRRKSFSRRRRGAVGRTRRVAPMRIGYRF